MKKKKKKKKITYIHLFIANKEKFTKQKAKYIQAISSKKKKKKKKKKKITI